MSVKKFQNSIGSNGWYYSMVDEVSPSKKPEGKLSVDYVVVGGGFVGVAATRRMAELVPNASILLIDATKIGLGTSGRCSGFIIDTPHKGDLLTDDTKIHSRAFKINRKGINWMEGIIKKEGIDCNWQKAGKFQVAASERGEGFLKGYKRMLENTNEEHRVLEKHELHSIMGTQHYRSAVFTPNCILMQPAAYLKGMVKAFPKNVMVFEDTLVEDLKVGPDSVTLKTVNAHIQCKKVILSVNVFSREFGYFKNKIVPVVTYASMTNPLTQEQQELYTGTYGWGLTSADKGGTTLRMTHDKRLVIRNHYTHNPNYRVSCKFIKKIGQQHSQGLKKRYPHLKDLKIAHNWGGVCAVSRNFGFFAGELEKNVFSALGHNGVGGARGSIAGKSLAEKIIIGESEDLELLSRTHTPCWNPPEPLLSIGIAARMAMDRFKSRAEL
nr:FAD-dependent oxidoreductase [uncultured Allomuricauda sp.]